MCDSSDSDFEEEHEDVPHTILTHVECSSFTEDVGWRITGENQETDTVRNEQAPVSQNPNFMVGTDSIASAPGLGDVPEESIEGGVPFTAADSHDIERETDVVTTREQASRDIPVAGHCNAMDVRGIDEVITRRQLSKSLDTLRPRQISIEGERNAGFAMSNIYLGRQLSKSLDTLNPKQTSTEGERNAGYAMINIRNFFGLDLEFREGTCWRDIRRKIRRMIPAGEYIGLLDQSTGRCLRENDRISSDTTFVLISSEKQLALC